MSGSNKGRFFFRKDKSKSSRSDDNKSFMEETKKDSFYDSGRTDSGILSGSNLVSDSCLSGEISPPPETTDGISMRGGKTDSYKRLDSGVDVGLSDQLSGLDIDERLNDLGSDNQNLKSGSGCHIPVVHIEGADSLPWEHYFQQDDEGDSSLHIAVISNRYNDLLTLVRMIPEPKYLDIRNDMRQTALHLAVLTSREKMVKLLVAAGASTNSVDHHGNTPLHLATAAGDLDLVKELTQPPPQDRVEKIGLRYKPPVLSSHTPLPEINMYNYEGLSCVHLALMGGHMTLLKNLCWFGADINAGELKGGLTAVHMASTMGDVGLVRTLVLELHANPCPLTYGGQSPFSLARDSGHLNMLPCLHELGSTCLGDSEEEDDEDHLAAHYYSDSEDEQDIQMIDRSVGNIRDFHLGIAV